jgi:penicillin-binding protein 2
MELHPDEILLDVHNLPQFDEQQFEGRVERPLPRNAFSGLLIFFALVSIFFLGRLGYLQVIKHEVYAQKSEFNSLDHTPIFAGRGLIYDRNGVELAWNSVGSGDEPPIRKYITEGGYASLLGYVSYPARDDKGIFWQTTTIGRDGSEKEFDETLSGTNGTLLIETDVAGVVLSGNTIEPPEQGKNVSLSIDSRIQSVLFEGVKTLAERSGYTGGAGAVMDITTGELLAITSYPEYDQAALSDGSDHALVQSFLTRSDRPFLFRMTEGLYTPGSIVKPFLALGALQEAVITPEKQILSTGELRLPNPYQPGTYTIFKDNDAHGWVDMRHAIAVSSNVYFYQIGGGFGSQEGLGIDRMNKYLSLFGLGNKTGINISGELEGTIPSIAWKAKRFPGDQWRIGDTYNTSIGQYGFQVTPIQMLRAVAAVASRGTLVTPTVLKLESGTPARASQKKLPIEDAYYSVVQDGMRMVVTEGTGMALNLSAIPVAAKSGTAQIKNNTRVNSWAIGFFPADRPRYAFTVLMEDGPKVSSGATHAFRPVLDYLIVNPGALSM